MATRIQCIGFWSKFESRGHPNYIHPDISITDTSTIMSAQQPEIVATPAGAFEASTLLMQAVAPAVTSAAAPVAAPVATLTPAAPAVDLAAQQAAQQQAAQQQAAAQLAAQQQAAQQAAQQQAAAQRVAAVQQAAAATAAQPGASKVDVIANATAVKTLEGLIPLLEAVLTGISSLQAEVNTLKATVVVSGGTRTAIRSRTSAVSSGGASGGDGSCVINPEKVKNKRLYWRLEYVRDPSVRSKWGVFNPEMKVGTPEAFNLALSDPKITSKSGDALYSAQAFAIWPLMSTEQQNEWGTRFTGWKQQNTAGATPAPLAADMMGSAPPTATPVTAAATAADVSAILGEMPF